MNTTKIIRSLKGLGLALAIVFSVGVFVDTGNAQNGRDRRDDDYRNGQYGRYDDDRYNGRDRNGSKSAEKAYKKGVKDGIKQAKRDSRNGQRSNNGAIFGNGGYGNNGGIWGAITGRGNNGRDRQAYEAGFRRGYAETMDRDRRYRRTNNGRGVGRPF
jgi:hypothetical protein